MSEHFSSSEPTLAFPVHPHRVQVEAGCVPALGVPVLSLPCLLGSASADLYWPWGEFVREEEGRGTVERG